MKPTTEALHVRIDNSSTEPAVTPIYQCSAFTADSPYFYSRKDNPNVAELERVLCVLEQAKHATAVACGMAAIYMVLDLLKPGDRVVVNRDVYGCSFKLFQRVAQRRCLGLVSLDLSHEESYDEIPADVAMVFFETPTNPFLKAVGIRRLSEHVKRLNPDALVVVDNTWATPLFQRPLQHGADVSLHSGTKYFSGHSDVMSGALLTDRDDLHRELSDIRFYGGTVLSPHSAWLVRRSLQTLEIRLQRHQEVTRRMVEVLSGLPHVRQVYYPEVDGVELTGYGGIIFFELRDDLVPRYPELAAGLKLFGTGTGMAAVSSMVAQPYFGSHASMSDDEKAAIGLTPSLVRLCFGLEDPEDLAEDLVSALQAIDHREIGAREAV